MKWFMGFFISLSIFSFIAFGISVAVLGTTPLETATVASEYTELDGSFSDIEITTDIANIEVYPHKGTNTKIFTSERLVKSVSAEIKDDRLIVKLDHSRYIFTDFFGYIGSLFSDNHDRVEVYIPERLYDYIHVKSNAGSTSIINIAAENLELDLNAGNLAYAQPEGNKAEMLNISLSAGNCTLYNAATNKFDISMSAGNIDIYGLTGKGDIDVSAGNGRINFAELDGKIGIDLSAGNVDINLPDDTSATITCDKSAGIVEVNYGDINEDMDDDDTVTLGEGKYEIFADVSAGSVYITDMSEEAEAPAVPEMPVITADNATTQTSQTSQTAQTHPNQVEVEVDVGDVEVDIGDINVDVKV